MTPATKPRLLTPRQVAEQLQVSIGWVNDHIKRRRPRLPAVRLGDGKKKLLRIRPEDLEEFIRKNLVVNE